MIRHQHNQLVATSLADLRPLVERLGARRIFAVLDRGALSATGAEPALRDALATRLVATFEDFTPNPDARQPLAAAHAALHADADTLLALGGGSCMDVAKVAALALADLTHAEQIVRAEARPARAFPVIAIPTTAGTGSEATHFSAVYVDGKKVSVTHPAIRPVGVVLDASLHLAMPAHVAAVTGLDALAQATESLWACGATPESDAHARHAQHLILEHLLPSVRSALRPHREAMMLGAHAAGHAINISRTTAAHALSYELTTRFNVPHGLAVALTLGHVAAFNARVSHADAAHPDGPDAARRRVHDACHPLHPPDAMPAFMRRLLADLGLPATLSQAGVTPDALEPMARAADTVRLSNNPRILTTADALQILTDAL